VKTKNKKKRLQGRLRDYQAMLEKGSREQKVQVRMDSGGYTRPGSNKK
jgi:hypothetical protein